MAEIQEAKDFGESINEFFAAILQIFESMWILISGIINALWPLFQLFQVFFDVIFWLIKNVVNIIVFFISLSMSLISNISIYMLQIMNIMTGLVNSVNSGLEFVFYIIGYVSSIIGFLLGFGETSEDVLF
jgi:phage-related protein